jgi:hypothetical protein
MIKRAAFRLHCKNWYPDGMQRLRLAKDAYTDAAAVWTHFQTEIGNDDTERALFSETFS